MTVRPENLSKGLTKEGESKNALLIQLGNWQNDDDDDD